ncbi:MAG: sulfatase-like hydrolase/transferase [Candidatus Cryptobacteroides sp.]
MKNKIKLGWMCLVLSVFTLLAYHKPFFSVVLEKTESGFNGVFITASLVLVMLALNYFVCYLLLRTCRGVGRAIIAASFVADAVSLYFINTYDVMIDASMMGNVFNTRFSEASGFFSPAAVLYVLLLGVLPAIYVCLRKIDFGTSRLFWKHSGLSLSVVVLLVFANMSNWPWIDRHSTVLGSLLMPWSYTVNTFRYYGQVRERNREEILLPDAEFKNEDKNVFVLIIGESARRDHFSLYGYGRETNPLLEKDGVTAIPAVSAATYTTAGVKAILDHKESDKLYEILPNYLYRAGADVLWRTSNWGEPPLHIEREMNMQALKEKYPDEDADYDGLLTCGLAEEVLASGNNKQLIVLHTSTSHGPTYNKRYPPEYEIFTPVCTTVEMSKADPQELMNSYDNTILYTDALVHDVIRQMESLPEEWKSCVLYVSDHGESLGEGKLYMHGVPISLAPKEQYEIPFIVWTSEGSRTVKEMESAVQYNVFHSVLDFLGADSGIYDAQMSIFTE